MTTTPTFTMPNMTNLKQKPIICNYASLNCNSLVKTNNPNRQTDYLSFLRQQRFSILSMQETHATADNIPSLEKQLHACQYIWTPHCGIASFSSDFQLTPIHPTTFTSDRYILCKVTHPHHFYEPFYILNLYAPASSTILRREFFHAVYQMIEDQNHELDRDRMIISGDFNYSYQRTQSLSSNTSARWLAMLEEYFYNSMHVNDLTDIPTFQRLSSQQSITSTIDYIFLGRGSQNLLKDTHIMRLNDQWSDHSVLSITWMVGRSKTGPGLWRANPAYAKHKEFCKHLEGRLTELVESLDSGSSAQQQWEEIKAETKKVIQSYGKKYVSWRTNTLRFLEQKRNRFLRSKPSVALKHHFLTSIDPIIASLQQELCDVTALKAGVRWRERGEKSASYLKKLHHQRENQQFMVAIQQDERDGAPPSSTSDPSLMQHQARSFYQALYQIDPVGDDQIDQYLATIQDLPQLDELAQTNLMATFELDDLLAQAARCPRQSSPGDDGLSYTYLTIIFRFRRIQPIILQVYNDALQHTVFPPSWNAIRVRLLPKKGDLTSLKNWRPISLINCDGKIFTRLLTQRLSPIMNAIINPQQTGFINGRFIGENGMVLHLLLQQARQQRDPGIGLLLDQEKAYDRVHPDYLRKTMLAFGFPSLFVECVYSLFFNNLVQININGVFTADVIQERGLRQGDPMSPLLFNLAIEPLLLSIQQDPQYQGYQPTLDDHTTSIYHPAPIKCLAYADDICAIIKDPSDFTRLWNHMSSYSAVSNARFNSHKTEAFSLSGAIDVSWSDILASHDITCYHNKINCNWIFWKI
ncbi:hypothetical protein [Absidia glauca]|uniref:Reverse transcriptase domain-containing protein n=1 Tax=Absidia glauca TaxID=4829 RepID=A0A168LUY7_ABSGL|nr:hypothetical protein [Absidia glauca]